MRKERSHLPFAELVNNLGVELMAELTLCAEQHFLLYVLVLEHLVFFLLSRTHLLIIVFYSKMLKIPRKYRHFVIIRKFSDKYGNFLIKMENVWQIWKFVINTEIF